MLKILYKKMIEQVGAMDKILVTLLLVVVGVAAVVGLTTWVTGQEDSVKTEAQNQIQSAMTSNTTN